MRQARAHVEVAEADLRLRQLEDAHRKLDDEQENRSRRRRDELDAEARRVAAEAEGRERARLDADERRQRETAEAEAQRQREAAERTRAERRRELIARGKRVAEGTSWIPGTFEAVPADVRAAMLVEIETTLRALPALEEMNRWEIERIAQGVVEKRLRPLVHEHAREAEQQRRHDADVQAEEQDRQRRREERARERAHAKGELVEFGMAYARGAIAEAMDARADRALRRDRLGRALDAVRLLISPQVTAERVRARLERDLTGDEEEADVEELVDEVVDEALGR